jgi:NagD protein
MGGHSGLDINHQRAREMGLAIPVKNVFTSSHATARYLKMQRPHGSAYVIGEAGLFSALEELDYTVTDQNPDYVVLGGTDRYDFERITRAINLIRSGSTFICTNPEPAGETKGGLTPASGAMAALIEKASGVAPFFIGKPNPIMTRYALNYLYIHSEDTILIGDRMDTDIIAGLESGLKTVLVLSGATQLPDLARFAYRPDYIIRSVADLSL